MADNKLPVANSAQVKAEGLRLMRMHKKPLAGVVGLYVISAVAGLAGPFLLGQLVDAISKGTTAGFVAIVALSLAAFVIIQTLLARWARRKGMVLGEKVFAQLREEFMEQVTSLPLSTVEKAGTGDLVSRTTKRAACSPLTKMISSCAAGVSQPACVRTRSRRAGSASSAIRSR